MEKEQSAFGTFATMASGAARMVGFVLFTLTRSVSEYHAKGGKKGHHEQELVSCGRGIGIAGPHESILGLGDLVM